MVRADEEAVFVIVIVIGTVVGGDDLGLEVVAGWRGDGCVGGEVGCGVGRCAGGGEGEGG